VQRHAVLGRGDCPILYTGKGIVAVRDIISITVNGSGDTVIACRVIGGGNGQYIFPDDSYLDVKAALDSDVNHNKNVNNDARILMRAAVDMARALENHGSGTASIEFAESELRKAIHCVNPQFGVEPEFNIGKGNA